MLRALWVGLLWLLGIGVLGVQALRWTALDDQDAVRQRFLPGTSDPLFEVGF